MSKLAKWIADNRVGVLFLGGASLMFVIMLYAGGCAISDVVREKVPTGIQRAIGAPARIPLSEHTMWWAKWEAHQAVEISYVQAEASKLQSRLVQSAAEGEQWSRSNQRSQETANVLGSIIDMTLFSPEAEMLAGTVPGGALALGALMGLAGLFIRKPGDAAKFAEEKRDSYNKSTDITTRVATEVLRSIPGLSTPAIPPAVSPPVAVPPPAPGVGMV